jgi:hypothetical protein
MRGKKDGAKFFEVGVFIFIRKGLDVSFIQFFIFFK